MQCQLMLDAADNRSDKTVRLLTERLCFESSISDGCVLDVEFVVTPNALDMAIAVDVMPDILQATYDGLTFHACPYLSTKVVKALTDTQFLMFVPWSNIVSVSNYRAISIKHQD
jgi:hypothetical protein